MKIFSCFDRFPIEQNIPPNWKTCAIYIVKSTQRHVASDMKTLGLCFKVLMKQAIIIKSGHERKSQKKLNKIRIKIGLNLEPVKIQD